MNKYHYNKGMTLIELMIVMAIVAIIASVAYPSYQEYMIKARRADATGDAQELAQWMERFYTENGRYDQDRAGNAVTAVIPITQSPVNGANPHYNIAYAAGANPQTNYNLTISPVSPVQLNDTRCAILTLNEAGRRCTAGGVHCSDSGNNADVVEVNYCW